MSDDEKKDERPRPEPIETEPEYRKDHAEHKDRTRDTEQKDRRPDQDK